MRISYIANNQEFISSTASERSQYQQLFMLVPKTLEATRPLNSHHIALEADSLPFQATTKLFHAPPSKRFRQKIKAV